MLNLSNIFNNQAQLEARSHHLKTESHVKLVYAITLLLRVKSICSSIGGLGSSCLPFCYWKLFNLSKKTRGGSLIDDLMGLKSLSHNSFAGKVGVHYSWCARINFEEQCSLFR